MTGIKVPYVKVLPRLADGFMLIVQGKIPEKAAKFSINFVCVTVTYNENSDIAFHVNPRFFSGNHVVRNTLVSGVWGVEERETPRTVLQKGGRVECIVLVTDDNYKVSFNGEHFCEYRHRLAKDLVNHLVVDGDIELGNIVFQGPGFEAISQGFEAISQGSEAVLESMTDGVGYNSIVNLLPTEHCSSPVLPSEPCCTNKPSDTSYSHLDTNQISESSNSDDISVKPPDSPIPSNTTPYPNCIPCNSAPYPNCTPNTPSYPNTSPYPNTSIPSRSISNANVNSGGFHAPYPNCNPFPSTTATTSHQTVSTGHYGTPPVAVFPQLAPAYNMPNPMPYRIATQGVKCDQLIVITGIPLARSSWFSVSIRCREEPLDVALMFIVRLDDRLVIRNSCRNGAWNQEERHVPYFPFPGGAPFEIVIQCRPDIFNIAVNDRHFVEYPNRGYPLPSVTSVLVEGEISVTRAFLQ